MKSSTDPITDWITHADFPEPVTPPTPPDPRVEREKHFINFKCKMGYKSKNEILRLCFDACEAINYLEARLKEADISTIKPEQSVPTKERKKWLGLKFR